MFLELVCRGISSPPAISRLQPQINDTSTSPRLELVNPIEGGLGRHAIQVSITVKFDSRKLIDLQHTNFQFCPAGLCNTTISLIVLAIQGKARRRKLSLLRP